MVAAAAAGRQRPIVDTFIGYNVLWFYAVAGLFKITGPNYIASANFLFRHVHGDQRAGFSHRAAGDRRGFTPFHWSRSGRC